MRVLIVGPIYYAQGGIAEYINNLLKNYKDNKGIDFIEFNTNINGNKLKKILFLVKVICQYLLKLVFSKIEIVHLHVATRGSFFRKSLLIVLAKLFRKKIIVHIHSGEFSNYYKNKIKIVRYILSKGNLIIVLNEEMQLEFKRIFNLDSVVLMNAIVPNKSNLYNPENKNIVFLGRLTHKKGIYDLLEAANILINVRKKSLNFILAGTGENEQVRNLIIKYNLTNNIKLVGWIDEKQKNILLSEAVMLILPSYFEGVPMCLLEAMNYGVPIVGSNIPGIRCLLKNDSLGVVFPLGNIDKLVEEIDSLFENRDRRNEISTKSFEFLTTHLSMDVYYSRLSNIYKRVLINDSRG